MRIQLGQRKNNPRDKDDLELPRELIISEDLKKSFSDGIELTILRELTDNWFEMYGKLKQFLIDRSDNDDKEVHKYCKSLGDFYEYNYR